MTQTYPDESVQGLLGGDWWVEDKSTVVNRGRLVRAFVPHVDQMPFLLVPTGRTEAREHRLADCEIKPLNITAPLDRARLPVAGLPCYEGEVRTVHRAKKRPLLILAEAGPDVPSKLVTGIPKTSTSHLFIGAPFYGVDQSGKRAGYPPEFVNRVRHCEYKQFFWDKLPLSGAEESLLRLEHIQPVGAHYMSLEVTPWRLSEDALILIDEWLQWFVYDSLTEETGLKPIVDLLAESASSTPPASEG